MNVQRCINALIANLPCNQAVISPGSRNAPVVYALHHSGINCHSIVDERSAAFVALGIAKETRLPVILSCTSGTAALNYYPAIAEAFYARVPLIILTADRPPEDIDAWDGQAIRQKSVYKNHIRAEFETLDDYDDFTNFEAIGKQVAACLKSEIAGPIHINIPIREPFYNFNDDGLEKAHEQFSANPVTEMKLTALAKYVGMSFRDKKVLVVHGMQSSEQVTITSDEFSVVLSDITSNQPGNMDYWDALLFSAQTKPDGLSHLEVLRPDVLVTTGTTTVSKGLKRFLRHFKPKFHFHLSKYEEVGNMFRTKPTCIPPEEVNQEIGNKSNVETDDSYRIAWQNITSEFEQRFSRLDWKAFNEFTAVNYILSQLPDGAILHLGNSMPVRYASFLWKKASNNIVRSNRGTSGIDGSTSTAVGNALVSNGPVYLITGDIAFFYDINALFNQHLPKNLKIILLNNRSGGIFEMISGPDKMGEAIDYQTTPHHYSAEHLAEHFDVSYFSGNSIGTFAQGMDDLMSAEKCAILEVFTDKEKNKTFFDEFKSL